MIIDENDEYLIIRMDNGLNTLDVDAIKEITDNISKRKPTIITGNDKAFSAGANVKKFLGLSKSDAYNISRQAHEMLLKITGNNMPVIAAIKGYALGGGFELALACDLRFADLDAKFGFPEIKLGIIPGWGGTQRLKPLIGETRAMEMILTGKIIDSNQAFSLGILNYIGGDYMNRAIDMASSIYNKSHEAVSAIKYLLRQGSLDLEMERFAGLFDEYNSKEGINAFLEKREPKFNLND
ncbi:enoyl-CoA hydratase/isomerase family protein [Picrophilus oshimae]|uniref:Short chain enoyl-CoA hydratase n=1 Tax=Picrophilus torridus (strain ATCC 700027 / DSM 9790 / JCM 10055 / NBRC 100828 / KAW 2/3) TaxID=1122961 RepID=A0A8G2L7B1_PICTO|nr:enoyl-CoA hydratase-related protein [Picrophilus oshimae]SMD30149.1 short chain enoyl-CoA hydratase [Picrophilus oshimae DSM 9789]